MSKATDSMFSEDQIADAVRTLGSYSTHTVVARVELGETEVAGEVLAAFAALAKTLKLPILSQHQALVCLREVSAERKRECALQNLRWQAERGEIVPANAPDFSPAEVS
jgi:hypothetical protein